MRLGDNYCLLGQQEIIRSGVGGLCMSVCTICVVYVCLRVQTLVCACLCVQIVVCACLCVQIVVCACLCVQMSVCALCMFVCPNAGLCIFAYPDGGLFMSAPNTWSGHIYVSKSRW